MTQCPSVGVVIPTRNRPAQLRHAIASVLEQDYPGYVQVVVVFDGTEPEETLADGDRVLVLANDRKPGLGGARNCGIMATRSDLVAFCDDDDRWRPAKLRLQVAALQSSSGAEFASCGITVQFDGRSTDRLAGTAEITHDDLIRSRMVMVHSSTYLAGRAAL
ncbi:MAG: glycosyltransferase family 2 protein, partial [Nocardiopsaceae bacterium]|nr:glycosyltransferase family 2 protein [Nocardiopsaceae bacterium]